jgi:DMSO/TMAO reductase YedYZ molybdopterin-dependent catalytic subunit
VTNQRVNGPKAQPPPARQPPVLLSVCIGALALISAMGLWWAGYAAGVTTFPPFDLADRLIQAAPGEVAVWAIANLQFAARNLALVGGFALFIGFGAVAGLSIRNVPGPHTGIAIAIVLAIASVALALLNNTVNGLVASLGLLLWFSLTLAATLSLAGVWIERVAVSLNDDSPDWLELNSNRTRREVLRHALIAGVLLGGGGWITGALLRNAGVGDPDTADGIGLDLRREEIAVETMLPGPLPTPVPATERPASFEAPEGVRARNTSNDDFYVIDISTRKPAIPDDSWKLTVHGLVEQPIELSYIDLLNMPSREMDGTLMCISFTFGNDLISSTRWTGVSLRDVLQLTGIQDTAVDLILRGAGGYSDSIPVAKALEEQTLLAYGMNGETLPRDHGYPCRLYVPNIYGEKNVKWLQEIEIVDYDYKGYWQERGWSDEAVINTIAVIDTPSGSISVGPDGNVPVGGITFAGSRGVQSVRLRIDDGDWVEAELEAYDPELLWQRWRYDWSPEPGEYDLTVQAVDGNGVEQETARRDVFPDGMTGLHTVTVRVQ